MHKCRTHTLFLHSPAAMTESSCVLVLFLLVVVTAPLPISIASPLKLRLSDSNVAAIEAAHAAPPPETPSTYFEVDRPHRPPPGSYGPCSTLLLSYSFGSTYKKPPITAPYSPPPCLVASGGRASVISLAVLEWRATSRGVQFDRIFGVWLGGVELLRGSTAEPRGRSGICLVRLQGRHQVCVPPRRRRGLHPRRLPRQHRRCPVHRRLPRQRHAPPLLPAPAAAAAAGVENSRDVRSASLAVPANAYRAVLEVYLSYHSDDEFWYMNELDGISPFREVTVQIDGDIVGAVWPFPVIYTGGISALIWKPISAIGSFNLPSYDVELTPFLGKLLDGEEHEFGFAVTNAQKVWFIDANLHLWLDPRSTATKAGIIIYDAPPLKTVTAARPKLPGNEFYYTTAFRHISATGWVQTTSYGKMTATWTQRFSFVNRDETRDNRERVINQTTSAYSGVHVVDHAGVLYSQEAQQSFPLYIYLGQMNQASNDTYTLATRVQHQLDEERVAAGRSGFWSRSLSNAQDCAVDVDVREGDAVGVSWGTQQTYRYESTDGCYYRDVASRGYSVVSDHYDEACVTGPPTGRVFAGGVTELAGAAAAGGPRLMSS